MKTMFNREPDGAMTDASCPMCCPLVPRFTDSAKRAFASGQRSADRALKAEEMLSGLMYRQALDAYEKVPYALSGGKMSGSPPRYRRSPGLVPAIGRSWYRE